AVSETLKVEPPPVMATVLVLVVPAATVLVSVTRHCASLRVVADVKVARVRLKSAAVMVAQLMNFERPPVVGLVIVSVNVRLVWFVGLGVVDAPARSGVTRSTVTLAGAAATVVVALPA